MPVTKYTVPDKNFIHDLESKNGHDENNDISMKDLMSYSEAKDCFFCKYINSKSLQENEIFYNFMKLYTDNASAVCKDAIFDMMLNYFNEHIKEHINVNLTVQEIENHFTNHTRYATDEVLTQINMLKGVRRHLMNQVAKMDEDGGIKINDSNVKLLVSINKEIRTLTQMKDELPNHLGYDSTLNF